MKSIIRTEAAVLQGLAFGPSYLLELIETIKTKTYAEAWMHTGAACVTLQALESKGLIKRCKMKGMGNRKYYMLTAAGTKKVAVNRKAVLNFFNFDTFGDLKGLVLE